MSTTVKMVSQAEYERLCRKGCASHRQPERDETIEDAYWWSICREVYHYLGAHFMFMPIEGASRGEVYRYNLLQLVYRRQKTPFNILAIADRYIKDVIGEEVDRANG